MISAKHEIKPDVIDERQRLKGGGSATFWLPAAVAKTVPSHRPLIAHTSLSRSFCCKPVEAKNTRYEISAGAGVGSDPTSAPGW